MNEYPYGVYYSSSGNPIERGFFLFSTFFGKKKEKERCLVLSCMYFSYIFLAFWVLFVLFGLGFLCDDFMCFDQWKVD